MICLACARRSALLGALAPEIERLGLDRWELLGLLSLSEDRLLEVTSARADLVRSLPLGDREAGVCAHDPHYPPALRLSSSPPTALFLAGGSPARLSELLARPVVAIVGSRHSTYYARDFSFALARDLVAAGITVLSGLSAGIEASAHHGALSAAGATITVMAGGARVPSPPQHDRLYRSIVDEGLAISELPPGFSRPQPWCYLARNRLIAAIAHAVVVVEAGERSGTLFTAELALRLGREIGVLPGRASDASAIGSNGLLRDGASLVLDASDVIGLLGGAPSPLCA